MLDCKDTLASKFSKEHVKELLREQHEQRPTGVVAKKEVNKDASAKPSSSSVAELDEVGEAILVSAPLARS